MSFEKEASKESMKKISGKGALEKESSEGNGLTKNTNIEILSMPGLSIDLKHKGKNLELITNGPLKVPCTPILKKINSRLQEEKPALIQDNKVIASAWLPPIPGPVFKRLIFAEIQIAMGKYIPETLSIELTRQNSSKYPPGTIAEELDTAIIKRVIDEALELGTLIITFTENDPLLRNEVFELIDYVDKKRAIVNCSTWGTDFSKKHPPVERSRVTCPHGWDLFD